MSWFNHGKTYTGSIGTDPVRGCFSVTTFNYNVRLVVNEGEKSLMAVCYFQLPWNARSNMKAYNVGIFEPNDFGIEVAENWIVNQLLVSANQECLMEKSIADLPYNARGNVLSEISC